MGIDASDISTYLGNVIWNHLVRNQAFTPPTTIYLSAHSADPGLTGANEVGTAGANGYARQAAVFAAASNKVSTGPTSNVTIVLPSNMTDGTPVPYLGAWDAATGGNFLFRIPLLGTPLECTAAASTDTITTGEAHGYAADDRVTFVDVSGSLPAGLTTGVLYFVLAASLGSNTLKVSTTSGGSAVDITADGGTVIRKMSVQTFNHSNQVVVSASSITLSI